MRLSSVAVFASVAVWVVILSTSCFVSPVSADTYELTIDITSDDYDHVANLTSDNFDSKTSDGRVWFVEFYAPWCGHCQRLAPIWKDLAREVSNESNIGIGRVDATEHTDLGSRFDVTSYPALKLLRNKGDLVFEYTGRRSVIALARWVRNMAREPLSALENTAALSAFATKEGWPAGFVFFGDRESHPTEHGLIRAEAEKLLNEVTFVSINNQDASKKYEVTPPSLVAFHKGQKFATLTAPFTEESVRDFVFYHKLPFFDQIHTNNSDFYLGETAYRRAVVAIVYPAEDSSYQNFLSRVEGISKAHLKLFSFAWVDAGEWFRWMRDVIQDKTEKRRLIVFDGYRSIYYESPKTDLKDPQSIIDFITAVHENNLEKVGAVAKGEGLTLMHQAKRISYEFMSEFQKDWKTKKIALLTTFTVSAMTVSTIVFLIFAPRNNGKRKTN